MSGVDAGWRVDGAVVDQVEDAEEVHALLLDVVSLRVLLFTHWRLVVVLIDIVHLSEECLESPLPLAIPLALPVVVVEGAGISGVLVEGFGLLDLLVGLWKSLWAAWFLGTLRLFTFLWAWCCW